MKTMIIHSIRKSIMSSFTFFFFFSILNNFFLRDLSFISMLRLTLFYFVGMFVLEIVIAFIKKKKNKDELR